MKILGIETSCDDTGIAIYDDQQGIISNLLYSQTKMHDEYGGIVPELAARDHVRKLLPLLKQVLQNAACNLLDIDAFAYTKGPGLMGALLVGAAFGKTLAYANNKPCIGIHHMEAHLLAPLLESPAPEFPFLALVVSGGHTLLIDVEQFGNYKILGESIDDAAGEAFDKTAKLLGLSYPGGPAIAELALRGNAKRFNFPRPMTDKPGLDFSFSGLKTSVMNTYEKCIHQKYNDKDEENYKADIAASFQEAVVETLFIKCQRALHATQAQRLVIAGGVSANVRLRERMQALPIKTYYPRLEFCVDNGAMVAYAGYLRFKANCMDQDLTITTQARWALDKIIEIM